MYNILPGSHCKLHKIEDTKRYCKMWKLDAGFVNGDRKNLKYLSKEALINAHKNVQRKEMRKKVNKIKYAYDC